MLASSAANAAPADDDPPDSGYFDSSTCSGANGVASNFGGYLTGTTVAPILFRPDLGQPVLDGGVVRSSGTVSFKAVGSCMASVAFQIQTKVCGNWGCSWETRNHGSYEYLWKHASEGQVSGESAMTCRSGTHSYRLHMAVVGPASISEEPKPDYQSGGTKGGAIGVDPTASYGQSADGPVVKLTC